MNLSIKEQVFCIISALRRGKGYAKALYISDLNLMEGRDTDSEAFQEGIDFLEKNHAISIEEAPEGSKIVLLDDAKLRSLFLSLPTDDKQAG